MCQHTYVHRCLHPRIYFPLSPTLTSLNTHFPITPARFVRFREFVSSPLPPPPIPPLPTPPHHSRTFCTFSESSSVPSPHHPTPPLPTPTPPSGVAEGPARRCHQGAPRASHQRLLIDGGDCSRSGHSTLMTRDSTTRDEDINMLSL